MRRETPRSRAVLPVLACALLCAGSPPAAAATEKTAEAGPAVELGAMAVSVEGVRQSTFVVARVTATFASAAGAARYDTPGGIVRLRDAALEALQDTHPLETDGSVDEAAIERRLHRTIARRAPGIESVTLEILGVRTDDRQ